MRAGMGADSSTASHRHGCVGLFIVAVLGRGGGGGGGVGGGGCHSIRRLRLRERVGRDWDIVRIKEMVDGVDHYRAHNLEDVSSWEAKGQYSWTCGEGDVCAWSYHQHVKLAAL